MAASPPQSSSPAVHCVNWSASARSFEGEDVCGDAYAVVSAPNGVLIAVIDGLGHGVEAATAAGVAVKTVADNADSPLPDLMQRCHEDLRRTRGAAITMVSIDASHNTMTWAGIGNVEGMLFRADDAMVPRRESLVLRGGVVGYQIPSPRTSTLPVFAGDVLVLVTDGIDSGFSKALPVSRNPDDIAADILEQHAKGTDDALVLAALYVGLRT